MAAGTAEIRRPVAAAGRLAEPQVLAQVEIPGDNIVAVTVAGA